MKKIVFVLPLFILFSCGGSSESEDHQTNEDSLYSVDNEWVLSAELLKKKLGYLQASFVEIGNKEVEETVCEEGATVPYYGSKEEMNVWLMTTYMLDNFSADEFGKNDFKMPSALIKNETPLTELNWLNINSLDSNMFNVYCQYPDLTNIPKKVTDEDGNETSNEECLRKADQVLGAIESGLFGVIAITDYLPPSYTSDTEYETGYVMGYIMFADWETGELSCISPFLAQNNEEVDFAGIPENSGNDQYSKEVLTMRADLQTQTYNVIDSIARIRTGFTGDVWVNSAEQLESFK
ncbi:MAG: hypothetical protein HUJ25_15510 [Crocinitomicaceae bacterium]|nr:hypothetical protein [Crocinitomicaceae bacterium]